MNRKLLASLLAIMIIASMALAACQPAAVTEAPTMAAEATATTAPAAAATATTAPAMESTATMAPAGEATATMAPAAEGNFPYEDVDPSGQEIVFWHQQTKAKEEALKAIADQFNQTNEWGITVTPEYQGSYSDIFTKMSAVLNTTDAPNIVVAYQNNAATYQLADALIDLNPLVDSPKWGLTEAEKNDFFQSFYSQDVFPNFQNQRLGFPPNRSEEVLYYNEDWLKELGYDAPPTTPDQFKEMACKAAQTPYSKATADGSMGYELAVNDASHFAAWTFAFGGDIYDQSTDQYTYNSDAAVNSMQFVQDLFQSGCAAQPTEQYGDQTDFGTGKLLFAIGSSSGLSFYRSAVESGANFNWSVAPVPHTTPDPVMNVYGASVSVPHSTPEKELASWLFIKFFTSPEMQVKWAEASEYFPVRKSAAAQMQDYFDANPGYAKAFDLLQYGKTEPPTVGYDYVRDTVNQAMATILSEPYPDVKPVLDNLNQDANAILEEQLQQLNSK